MATPPHLDWSTLEDAYGAATDLPDDLRGLLATAPRKPDAALDRLWARLCHQGSVYPASATAVPYLLDLASNPRTKGRGGIVDLLAGIAVGDHTNFLDGALSAARRSIHIDLTDAVEGDHVSRADRDERAHRSEVG